MSPAWLETFQRDPAEGIGALFQGTAMGAASRLDAPEFLLQAFANGSAEDRASLDGALYAWLFSMRDSYADEIQALGDRAYGKRIGDALIALQLLELPSTRERIRTSLDEWLRWLRPLRTAPERDPALECWRLMAIGQTDTRHEPDWLRLAVDRRPEYLNVALAGLRSLPNHGDARINQTLLLQALFRHAVSAYHDHAVARRFVNRRLAALRAAYPRSPQHWRDVLIGVLETNEYDEHPVAKELRHALRPTGSQHKPVVHRLPSRNRLLRLETDIRDERRPPPALTKRFFGLIAEYANHADSSGSGHYFVRSLHNLANPFLDRGCFAPSQMPDLRVRIEQALAWEPWNPFCWMLLGDWYGAEGDVHMRESVLREMLRLFPDDEPSRVELARILIDRGGDHREEAQRRLREAASLSDDHLYARVELARFLMSSGDDGMPEAEDLLRHVLDREPRNAVASRFLGRLLAIRPEHWDNAESLLKEALRQSPDDLDALVPLGRLLTRRHRVQDAQTLRQVFTERNPSATRELHDRLRFDNDDDVSSIASDARTDPRAIRPPTWRNAILQVQASRGDAVLAQWARELAHRAELASEFARAERAKALGGAVSMPLIRRAAQRCDPLAGFYAQWLAVENPVPCPPNAWAWRACQFWQQSAPAERWDHLERQFPDAAAETSFLHVLCSVSQPVTAEQWCGRFSRHANDQTRPAVSFIRKRIDGVARADSDTRAMFAFAVLANRALEPPAFATV